MADFIDKITIKDPTGGSDKDYPIGADSSNVKYKSTSVYSELNDLNANKVDKHQTGGIDDRLMTKDEADKLAGIETGAEVNIQSDWTQSDNTQADYIKNKPTNLVTYNSEGKIDASYLPSYVDDVLEYASITDFPVTGEDGKIYIAKDTNKTYRWSGTIYVEISESLALGYTHSTAFYGDEGKAIKDLVPSGATGLVDTNDTRLSNARPASDVSAWAKAANKPSYDISEITGITVTATDPGSGGALSNGKFIVVYNA